MGNESDEPLRKVTLNLYKADVEWLEKRYGQGWTGEVRDAVRAKRVAITNAHNILRSPTHGQ